MSGAQRGRDTPRLRMFCGPNGSGKSTLMRQVEDLIRARERAGTLGVVVNADDMLRALREAGGWVVPGPLRTMWTADAVGRQIRARRPELPPVDIEFDEGAMRIAPATSYTVAALAQWLCHALLQAQVSLSFETVMSHESKVELLSDASKAGFRVYVYWVSTEHPDINVSRVEQRVRHGGHDVPEDRIVERYVRSTRLLPRAVEAAHRAYLFDNSGTSARRIAEFENGELVHVTDDRPGWYDFAALPTCVGER